MILALKRLYANPYLVLSSASLLWAGNSIIGKVAIGEISPMTLTCLRWLAVMAILAVFFRRDVWIAARSLAPRWPWMMAMGALGYTAFNALLYLSAYHTSATNMTMLQGSLPVMVLAGGALITRTAIGRLQGAGTILTLLGVVVIASGGDVERLARLQFNIGDLYVLIACILYAGYTLALRQRPPVSGFHLFAGFAFAALLAAIPLIVWEIESGQWFPPTTKGWLILAYVAIGPSLLAQLFYIRGVDLIGPARAGLFVNLIPVFGALMAVIFLGEPFAGVELVALLLVTGGIAIAEIGKQRVPIA